MARLFSRARNVPPHDKDYPDKVVNLAVSGGGSVPLMNDKETNPPASQNLYRQITEKLYECLVTGTYCKSRFSFGTRTFCLWLLKKESDRAEEDVPCRKSDHKDKD